MKKTVKKILIIILSFVLCNLICIASYAAGSNNKTVNESIVEIIRTAVAKWYYVMRLVVIAFMLILLIFIGIKMAISSIASEKAVYKQMLVDWVVGMIIVFSIHYIMIGILNINGIIVSSLENLAKEKVQLQEEYEYGVKGQEKTNAEMQMTLYETVRTRAYSLKLTDGFTGMVIYGVLVYYAWRFALIYLRRMINIVILTLMAPVISASYAFNKVITGKSKIFSTWLNDYIMNIVIQIVHALIYVSFVSTALQLSMKSLAGTIIAFVLLSFMAKADGILRTIFKVSGGMTDKMATQSFGQLKNEFRSTAKAIVGGQITKKAMGITYRVATKPVRKVGEVAFGKAMETLANSERYNEHLENKKEEKEKERFEKYKKMSNWEERDDKIAELEEENERLKESLNNKITELNAREKDLKKKRKKKKNIKGTDSGIKKIQKERKELEEQYKLIEENNAKIEELMEEENAYQDAFIEQQLETQSVKEVFKDNLKSLFDYTKYVEEAKDEKGEVLRDENGRVRYRRKKTKREGGVDEAFWRKKESSIGKTFFSNARIDKLLGLEEEEKNILKQEAQFWKSTITGVITSIAGFPALAINPTLGMGLLAQAGLSRMEVKSRRMNLRRRTNGKYGKMKFKAFGDRTKTNIEREAMRQMEEAERLMNQQNIKKHKKFFHKVLTATTYVTRPIAVGSLILSGVTLGMPLYSDLRGKTKFGPSKDKYTDRLVDVTFFEEEKLAIFHQKQLKKKFNEARQQLVYLNAKDMREEYQTEFEKYEEKIKNNVEKNDSEKKLFINDVVSFGNAVNVGNTVIQINPENETTMFIKDTAEITSKENITNSEKINLISQQINKNKTLLIENSITKVCASKGIIDINKMNLEGSEMTEVKNSILSVMEATGIVKKGEISLERIGISNETIKNVYNDLVNNQSESNQKIENQIVQDAYLEYIDSEKITNVNELKNDEAKKEIYEIVLDKIMPDSSKKSAKIIEELNKQKGDFTGEKQNEIIDDFEVPETLKQAIETTSSQIIKIDVTKATKSIFEDEKQKEKLIERQVNRKINDTKTKLEEAVYTEEQQDLLDEEQLNMLFILSDLKRQNLRAQKVRFKIRRDKQRKHRKN